MTWRPCENSYPALLGEVSKALQDYTCYQGNSQLMADDPTAFDFSIQMAHRTFDENGVRQVKEPDTAERTNKINNLWFGRRDESTPDEKTHDLKLYKELVALFKKTVEIKRQSKRIHRLPSGHPSHRPATYYGISHGIAASRACPQNSTGELGNSTALVPILARGIARDTGASDRETRDSISDLPI